MGRSAILSVRILGDAKGAVSAMRKTSEQSSLMGRALGIAGKVGVAALGAVAAVAGTALVKGFSRLTAIENAQAKLRGLGHDAGTVETIMGNALTSVKGTAFGLDEAATTAAGAVAAGIKPGTDLERMLSSVANAAAAAGTPMSEMGAIFNKVATVDMAQMDVLNQVADRGIPIMTALADTLGVSTGEVRKMASAGQIGFAEFEAAMVKASGTVATEMGKTTTGAFANMNAALGRLGAAVLEGIFPAFATTFTAAAGFIDQVTEKVGPLADSIGASLGDALAGIGPLLAGVGPVLATMFDGFKTAITTVAPLFQPVVQAFTDLVPQAAALLQGLSPVGLVFQGLAPLFPQIGQAVAQIAAQFGVFLAALIPVAVQIGASIIPVITTLAQAILPVLVSVLGTVAGVLPSLVPAFAAIAQVVGTVLAAVAPLAAQLIGALLPVIGQLVSGVLPPLAAAFTSVVGAVLPVVQVLLGLLIPAFQFLLPIIVGVVTAIVGNVIGAVQGIVGVITGVVNFVTAIFSGNWAAAWQALGQIVSSAVQAVVNLVQLWFVGRLVSLVRGALTAARGIFTNVWNGILSFFRGIGSNLANVARSFMDGIRLRIMYAMDAVRSVFSAGWSAITGFVGRAFTGIRNFVTNGMRNMSTAVSNGIRTVGNFFRRLPGQIGGWLSGMASRLLRIGQDMMRGLTRGIGNGIKWVKDKLIGGVTSVIDGAKRLLGINSPSRVFATMGGQIAQGMAVGIQSQQAQAVRAVSTMAAAVTRTGRRDLAGALDVDLGSPRAGGSLRLGAGGHVVHNKFQVTIQAGVGDPVEIGREVDRVLTRYRRTTGTVSARA